MLVENREGCLRVCWRAPRCCRDTRGFLFFVFLISQWNPTDSNKTTSSESLTSSCGCPSAWRKRDEFLDSAQCRQSRIGSRNTEVFWNLSDSLNVTVSLTRKLQRTFWTSWAWRNPFPLTTTWKDSRRWTRITSLINKFAFLLLI